MKRIVTSSMNSAITSLEEAVQHCMQHPGEKRLYARIRLFIADTSAVPALLLGAILFASAEGMKSDVAGIEFICDEMMQVGTNKVLSQLKNIKSGGAM